MCYFYIPLGKDLNLTPYRSCVIINLQPQSDTYRSCVIINLQPQSDTYRSCVIINLQPQSDTYRSCVIINLQLQSDIVQKLCNYQSASRRKKTTRIHFGTRKYIIYMYMNIKCVFEQLKINVSNY